MPLVDDMVCIILAPEVEINYCDRPDLTCGAGLQFGICGLGYNKK